MQRAIRVAPDLEVGSRLIDTHVPRQPEGVVLVLHGGASRGPAAKVSPAQLSVLRMIPVAHRVASTGGRRLAVFRVLNTARGWNTGHTPVDDVHWALGEVRRRLDGEALPTCLVGHSLGGRAALLASAEPAVVSAVALNPWVYPQDAPADLPAGRRLFIVHGDADRIAAPSRSRAVATALARRAEVGYVSVRGGKHAMLARGRLFDTLAADLAVGSLLGAPVGSPAQEVLQGSSFVEV